MKSLFTHYRKAEEKTMFIWILFAAVVFLVLVLVNVLKPGEQMKKIFPFLKSCTDYGGKCIPQTDSCDSSSKLDSTKTYLQGSESCPDLNKKGQVCCMPQTGSQDTSTPPPSAECNNKKSGDPCAVGNPTNRKVCNDNLVCVTRCEYCNDHSSVTALCPTNVVVGTNNIAVTYGNLGCTCSSTACTSKKPNGDCLQVTGQAFCDASADYCCNT